MPLGWPRCGADLPNTGGVRMFEHAHDAVEALLFVTLDHIRRWGHLGGHSGDLALHLCTCLSYAAGGARGGLALACIREHVVEVIAVDAHCRLDLDFLGINGTGGLTERVAALVHGLRKCRRTKHKAQSQSRDVLQGASEVSGMSP